MNENVKKVFEMLGLEPNEIFGINGLEDNCRYKLNSDLQFLFLDSNGKWIDSTEGIGILLRNTNIILKLPKPSEFEIAILKRCLEKGMNWIAEVDSGEIWVYEEKPTKKTRSGIWRFTGKAIYLQETLLLKNDFTFIKNGAEPVNIQKLLKDCGVIE